MYQYFNIWSLIAELYIIVKSVFLRSIYIFKKVILNGWDFQNFWEAQVEKCGQSLKNS